jgi:hypothetical protein
MIVFFILWVMGGGITRALDYAHTISNPIELLIGVNATGTPFKLPGQPDYLSGPDLGIADSNYENALYEAGRDDQSSLSYNPTTFGNTSPYHGSVHLSSGAVGGSSAQEYFIIDVDSVLTTPISLSGWSVQSAYSGVRFPIPPAAPLFAQGVVNAVKPVSLDPGGSAIVSSGIPPTGVSFRENSCIGYLAQFQQFTPPIQAYCPSATEIIPDTPENRRVLDDSCFDYLDSLPPCTFPQREPAEITPACASAVANALSYNNCVNHHQLDRNFYRPIWRLYLGSAQSLWRTHDSIRLLDEHGQVVDVLTF